MSNYVVVSAEKGNIKLLEYSDPTFTYADRIFVQIGCCGLYVTPAELKDLATVINYYLNMEDIDEIKIKVGGEHVAT